jgi:MFS family permease
MVALIPVSFVVAYLIGTLFMSLLDVAEGDLLPTAGAAGWLAALVVLGVLLSAPTAGVLLARRGLRLGGGRAAMAALVVNALALAWLALPSVVQLLIQLLVD